MGLASLALGVETAATGVRRDGIPAFPYFMFGARPADSGTLVLGDRERVLSRMTPQVAMKARMAFVPADRQRDGSLPSLSIGDNLSLLVLDRYFDEYDSIGTDTDARGPHMLQIEQLPTVWRVRQVLADPEGDHDWGVSAVVDLASSDERGEAVVTVTAVGPASERVGSAPVGE